MGLGQNTGDGEAGIGKMVNRKPMGFEYRQILMQVLVM
jgi:hypothetical protein